MGDSFAFAQNDIVGGGGFRRPVSVIDSNSGERSDEESHLAIYKYFKGVKTDAKCCSLRYI